MASGEKKNLTSVSKHSSAKKKKRYVYIPDLSDFCTVCGDASPTHHHFGAVTCYSCRAFFRRTAEKIKDAKRLKCKTKTGRCVITLEKRNCIQCRYNKCLSVGMSPELLQGTRKSADLDSHESESTVHYDLEKNASNDKVADEILPGGLQTEIALPEGNSLARSSNEKSEEVSAQAPVYDERQRRDTLNSEVNVRESCKSGLLVPDYSSSRLQGTTTLTDSPSVRICPTVQQDAYIEQARWDQGLDPERPTTTPSLQNTSNSGRPPSEVFDERDKKPGLASAMCDHQNEVVHSRLSREPVQEDPRKDEHIARIIEELKHYKGQSEVQRIDGHAWDHERRGGLNGHNWIDDDRIVPPGNGSLVLGWTGERFGPPGHHDWNVERCCLYDSGYGRHGQPASLGRNVAQCCSFAQGGMANGHWPRGSCWPRGRRGQFLQQRCWNEWGSCHPAGGGGDSQHVHGSRVWRPEMPDCLWFGKNEDAQPLQSWNEAQCDILIHDEDPRMDVNGDGMANHGRAYEIGVPCHLPAQLNQHSDDASINGTVPVSRNSTNVYNYIFGDELSNFNQGIVVSFRSSPEIIKQEPIPEDECQPDLGQEEESSQEQSFICLITELEMVFTTEERKQAKHLLYLHSSAIRSNMRHKMYEVMISRWLGQTTTEDLLMTVAEGRARQNYYHYTFMTGLPNFDQLSLSGQRLLMKKGTGLCFNLNVAHFLCGHDEKTFLEQENKVGLGNRFETYCQDFCQEGFKLPAINYESYFMPGWARDKSVENRFKEIFEEIGMLSKDGSGLIYSLLYSTLVFNVTDWAQLAPADVDIVKKGYQNSCQMYMRYIKHHLGWKRAKYPKRDPQYIFRLLNESVDIIRNPKTS